MLEKLAWRAVPVVIAGALVGSVVGRVPTWASSPAEHVRVVQTPDGGIQPQVVADARGNVHLLYLKGEPGAADVYYRQAPGGGEFGLAMRVNSHPGSAVAMGTVRGGQLAVGKDGRVHVAWNGSQKAQPRGVAGGSPMLYTRSDPGRTAFEPQRNLMRKTIFLDGGGSVAADDRGHVYVVWHGARTKEDGEGGRRLWIARSRDSGATFTEERPAFSQPTGACACCGSKAFADSRGNLFVLYRSATEKIHRDMWLLASTDHGETFSGASIHPWQVDT